MRPAKAGGGTAPVNDDVVDLYNRVPVGTKVAVIHR
jgi:hypothetical protein